MGQRPWGSKLSGAERDVAPRRSDLHPVPAPGRASLARLASLRPPLSLSPSFLRSLSLSLPSAARCLAPSPCALPEMSHYNGTSSTPHSLFSHVDPLTSSLDSTLLGGALEAAGEEARDKEEEEEAREGRGGTGAALPPGPARGRADASRTPSARKAGSGEGGSARLSH